MYIGSTGPRGLHHLVYEVVDNSVDEALQGHCDHIVARLAPDGSVTVSDNGRGIPVDIMPENGLPAAEIVLTKLHAGGKFGGEGYKVSGGLHGVGISVVNALSSRLTLQITRDGYVWTQRYERGEPMEPLARGAESDDDGTIITFLPDDEIFEETEFSFDTLSQRLREMAFLTRGLKIELIDERAGGESIDLQVRRRHRRLHRLRERGQGDRPQGRHLLRERHRGGPGRAGHAVEPELRGVHLLVRQQHQHARGRHAPLRLQGVPHAHAQ